MKRHDKTAQQSREVEIVKVMKNLLKSQARLFQQKNRVDNLSVISFAMLTTLCLNCHSF